MIQYSMLFCPPSGLNGKAGCITFIRPGVRLGGTDTSGEILVAKIRLQVCILCVLASTLVDHTALNGMLASESTASSRG